MKCILKQNLLDIIICIIIIVQAYSICKICNTDFCFLHSIYIASYFKVMSLYHIYCFSDAEKEMTKCDAHNNMQRKSIPIHYPFHK